MVGVCSTGWKSQVASDLSGARRRGQRHQTLARLSQSNEHQNRFSDICYLYPELLQILHLLLQLSDQDRARDQSQDRQNIGADIANGVARPRRRGDRIGLRCCTAFWSLMADFVAKVRD